MDNINEINSYNSLTMSPNSKKELRSSTSYSTTKINIGKELNEILKPNNMSNTFKRVQLGINNNNPDKISVNTDKVFNNTQNVSTKEEDSSSSLFTKLPKIQKHLTSATLNGEKILNSNNYFSKENDSSNSNILSQKDYSSLNTNSAKNNNLAYRIFNSSKNKYRSMGSANSIYSHHIYKYNNYNSFISPPDPLLKRTVIPKVHPKFGKMKQYITLPEFKVKSLLLNLNINLY